MGLRVLPRHLCSHDCLHPGGGRHRGPPHGHRRGRLVEARRDEVRDRLHQLVLDPGGCRRGRGLRPIRRLGGHLRLCRVRRPGDRGGVRVRCALEPIRGMLGRQLRGAAGQLLRRIEQCLRSHGRPAGRIRGRSSGCGVRPRLLDRSGWEAGMLGQEHGRAVGPWELFTQRVPGLRDPALRCDRLAVRCWRGPQLHDGHGLEHVLLGERERRQDGQDSQQRQHRHPVRELHRRLEVVDEHLSDLPAGPGTGHRLHRQGVLQLVALPPDILRPVLRRNGW